jgi:hypothetical protein
MKVPPEPAGARSWGVSPPISMSVPPPPGTRNRGRLTGEVNRMIAAAINADPRWFWHGPDA